ncbi:RHS repeat domain-containing protein [Bacteroides thetaiotaomicron]|uniref:RHS repeat domain-containing protein n=2 Tax=Bacteroides thetaiotaomicron TaxID=818 RepID=UPI00286FA548|nr:RHS repeat-associated core domain-containing protein [Bacteroides thetaiotaomicron]
MHESVFRAPDKVGNLYREDGCKGREYDRGGRLLWDGKYHYRYDCEGNLVHKSRRDVSVPENGHTGKKGWLGMLFSADDVDTDNGSKESTPFACWQPGDTCYEWQANGMLAGVRTPDGRTVMFGYDALGRRVSKRTGNTVHRFGWDGNVVLHEWDTDEARRPRLVTDETGREEYDGTEKPEGLVTWVYDGTSFTPVAKMTDGERYTIVHDYLGTPTQAYDSEGNLVWEMLLDVYGKVTECHGDRTLVPFRYQGQYEDEETGLYYNRFRYYSPQMGIYISSDPIGLAGNNPTLYGYVQDVNTWLDVWGLHCSKKLAKNLIEHGIKRPDNTAAHHIVGSGKQAKPANDILKKHNIDIDSHVNGVFLPNSSQSSASGLLHTGRHTNDYINRVNEEIVAADQLGGKDAVLRQLDIIREGLLNGTYTPPQKL